MLGLFGVTVTAAEIYPHLAPPGPPPDENPDLVYAKFLLWGTAHNALIARAEEAAKARDAATALAIEAMKREAPCP